MNSKLFLYDSPIRTCIDSSVISSSQNCNAIVPVKNVSAFILFQVLFPNKWDVKNIAYHQISMKYSFGKFSGCTNYE